MAALAQSDLYARSKGADAISRSAHRAAADMTGNPRTQVAEGAAPSAGEALAALLGADFL